MFRRVLLALLTALIVSRPFLRGESVGLSSGLSDPGGLVWAFLALAIAATWGGWRLWSGRGNVAAGLPELLLLLAVGVFFLTAAWASYRRAALLAGWEWLGLLVLLFLVRQLATTQRERAGLLSVALATGVALAAQGVYQAAWELPQHRRLAGDDQSEIAEHTRQQLGRRLESPSTAENFLLALRIEGYRAHGPYLFSSTLACALALLCPVMAAAAWAAWRLGADAWQRYLVLAALAIAALGLVLTREWLTVLMTLAAASVCLPRWRYHLLGGSVALALLLYYAGFLAEDLKLRADGWGAAWRLLLDGANGWTGVGLGQSGFWVPRYLSEEAGAPLGPNSGLLEAWAEGGILAAALLVGMAVAIAFAVRPWWRETPPAQLDAVEPPGDDLPWELYLGGMLGVVLAFLIRASTLLQDDLWPAALTASLGAMAWFAAFAAYEQLPWPPRERVLGLGCGALAAGLSLLIGPGLAMPSLMGLVLAVAGLLLAEVRPAPNRWLSGGALSLNAPAPVFGALAFGLLTLVLVPVTFTSSVNRRAQLAGLTFQAELARPAAERKVNLREYLNQQVLTPLEEAYREEKKVVQTLLGLSRWRLADWELDPRDLSEYRRAEAALTWAARAQDANLADPQGAVQLTQARLRIGQRMAQVADLLTKAAVGEAMHKGAADGGRSLAIAAKWRELAEKHFKQGADELGKALPLDPTNPEMHFRLARLLYEARDLNGARAAAAEALRLDARVGRARRLPNPQRELAEEWSRPAPRK
jgi:hypothetical protein